MHHSLQGLGRVGRQACAMALHQAQGQRGKYLTLELARTRNPVENLCASVSKFQSAKIGADAPSPIPQLFPVDHATKHPCPQCGTRQWLQGVTYYRCASCGYRDGPMPEEILAQQEGTG